MQWLFPFVLQFQALIDATSSESDLEDESGVRMVALFDHEEVGSDSAQGAGSPAMLDALSRITNSFTSDSKVFTAPPSLFSESASIKLACLITVR